MEKEVERQEDTPNSCKEIYGDPDLSQPPISYYLYILKKYAQGFSASFFLSPDVCMSQHNSGLDLPLLIRLLFSELIYGCERGIVSLLIKDNQLHSPLSQGGAILLESWFLL